MMLLSGDGGATLFFKADAHSNGKKAKRSDGIGSC